MSSRFNEAWCPHRLVSYNPAQLMTFLSSLCPHYSGQGMECVIWNFWVLLLLLPGKLLSFQCLFFIWKLIWNFCPLIRFVHDWTVGPQVVRSASHKDGIFRESLVGIWIHFLPGSLGIKIARYWGMLCLLWLNEIMKIMKEGKSILHLNGIWCFLSTSDRKRSRREMYKFFLLVLRTITNKKKLGYS